MAEIERRRSSAPFPSLFSRGWPDLIWRDLGDWADLVPETFAAEPGMRVEEFVDDGTLVVKAEMPGIDPDKDVEITVHDNTIRIRATREQESETRDKDHYRSEFQYGQFTRVLPLPAGASEADVKAHYDDGILEIRVPIRTEKAEATKIPVARK